MSNPPICYICHEEGPHSESGQPLICDGCSCRNGNGCVHLSCAVGLARTKSKRAISKGDGIPIRECWMNCPICHQGYTNIINVGMASELVAFVTNEYPDDEMFHLMALLSKLKMLWEMEDGNVAEINETASKIISLAGKLEATTEIQLPRQAEAGAFCVLGILALDEGTQESISLALDYFERSRNAWEELGDGTGTMEAELLISKAKSRIGRDDVLTIEQELEKFEAVHESFTSELVEGAPPTIGAGINLVKAYKKAGKTKEANALLKKLADTAHRVHGKNHYLARYVVSHQSQENFDV